MKVIDEKGRLFGKLNVLLVEVSPLLKMVSRRLRT